MTDVVAQGPRPRGQTMVGPRARLNFDDIMASLEHVEFLAHIRGKQRSKHVGKLVQESFLRVYEDGEKILRQGEHGHTMFVLLDGKVDVDAMVDGERRHLATLESSPGRTVWFGEGVVLGRTPRNASVTSSGRTTLLEMEKIRLERLDKACVGVIASIEKTSEGRSISSYLTQHRAFSVLDADERKAFVDSGKIRTADRGDTIYQVGDRTSSVLILKAGVCKLSVQDERGTKVLAYFSAGDVVGMSDGLTRPGTLTAMGFVEAIEIPRNHFDAVRARVDARVDLRSSADGAPVKWSDQLDKALNVGGNKIAATAMSSKTSMMFVEEFLKEGAQLAQSLLTIDLDLCIRCGNCVRACESRHGFAKMTRRGKRLVRRRDNEEGNHQPLLLPSSCRHCESPECMIGCPTGAIHRKTTGEVAIHDFCIGCSNCALRCPWDNITMVSTPDRWVLDRVTGGNLATPKIASKCDLCAGYDEANCVNNCPTQAILRVEPSYFPEVREAIGGANRSADNRTVAEQQKDYSRLLLGAISALLAVGMLGIYLSAEAYFAFSQQGLVLGLLAVFFMLAATALAFRRRLRKFPLKPPHPDQPADPKKAGRLQLGAYYVWARAHVWFGGLAFVAVLLHSGFRLGGTITSLLVFLLSLEVLTGIAGVIFYRLLPRMVSRIERDSQVQEDVEEEREELLRRREELLAGADPNLLAAAQGAKRAAPSLIAPLFKSYDPAKAEGLSLDALANLLQPLDRAQLGVVQRVVRDAIRLSEIRAILWLYRLRRGWLATHITITAMVLTLVVVHVGAVAFFYLRILG